jgi:hypothetical protein
VIAHFKITTMDILKKTYGIMFLKHSLPLYPGLASKTVGFLTSHRDADVDEEGFMTMMFELGKTYPLMIHWAMNGSLRVQFMTWIDMMQDRSTTNKM